MNGELHKRLYDFEVAPPEAVWNRLSLSLDEINSDNKLAGKIYDSTATPAITLWEKISRQLYKEDTKPVLESNNKGIYTNFRRLAVAAAIAGVFAITYFLFFTKNSGPVDIAGTRPPAGSTDSVASPNEESDTPTIEPAENPVIVKAMPRKNDRGFRQASIFVTSNSRSPDEEPAQLASLDTELNTDGHLEGKVFNKHIDDLSLIAANNNYVSMINADGRLVKIPSHLAGLVPYLQQKPSDADYLDILFEESTYWKDKFREWRQRLADSPVTPSMDNFFDIISLMKTIQDK